MVPLQAQHWTEDGAYVQPYVPQRRALPHNVREIAAVLVREQSPIRLGTGRQEAILPVHRMIRKLGATTFRLWATLLTMRDKTCETHPSLPGLARAAGMSVAQTAKSMARLRQFELVEDYGFTYRQVPCSCTDGCWGHKIYVRHVYGLVRESGTGHFVALVPRETVRLLDATAGQGGKRKGAGRPRKAVAAPSKEAEKDMAENTANKSKVVAYKNQEPVSQRVLTDSLQNTPLHGEFNSSSPRAVQTKREALERFLSSTPSDLAPPSLQPKAQPTAPSLAQTETPAAPAPAGDGFDVVVDGKPCDIMEALRAEGAQCIAFGGGYKGPRQRYTPEEMQTLNQISAMIEVVRVPAPPKVYEEQTETQRLFLLRTAYRATHEKVMRAAYWRPKREQTAKERAALLAAAEALRAKNVSPLAWAKFSFHQWANMGKKTAPTPGWVWNAARIEKHAGWCNSAVGTLHSNIPIHVPSTHTLMQRLDLLRQRLGWGSPTRMVLSEILPAAELQALLRRQLDEKAAAQKEIHRRIDAGEWVWS